MAPIDKNANLISHFRARVEMSSHNIEQNNKDTPTDSRKALSRVYKNSSYLK